MQRVLITGGTGTLGYALVDDLYDKAEITIYSRSELNQARMKAKYPRCKYIVGDVRDYSHTLAAITGHDTVIHCAAMKRIPECEAQPHACYETNVLGSEVVATACLVSGVETCIGISTDKACQPVTVYGASKLLMERLFTTMPNDCRFIMVRYGNVLESNGSVIPIWRKQKREGKPTTITHRKMTRFWMTPYMAVASIKMAYDTLAHSDVLVPKLKGLSISQMAIYIQPDNDIVEIGLRSAERLHEYLVSEDETSRSLDKPAYIINDSGELGESYRSDRAPQLSQDEFMAMLAEVEG